MAERLSTAEPNAVIADQGMVYCRFPDGTVEACDSSPLEIMKKINRGIVPLGDYGQFGSNVYYMDHPFEPLFQAGGARELSVAQIVSLGYHLHPPMVPTCEQHVGADKSHLVHTGRADASTAKAQGCWRGAEPARFSQLDGLETPGPPETCEFCGRDDLPTEAALKQHQAVMHNDRRQQQALGEAIVTGLRSGGIISSSSNAETVAAAVAAALQALGYGSRPPASSASPDDDDEETEEASPTHVEARPGPGQKPKPQLSVRQREALARGPEVARQRAAAARGARAED